MEFKLGEEQSEEKVVRSMDDETRWWRRTLNREKATKIGVMMESGVLDTETTEG